MTYPTHLRTVKQFIFIKTVRNHEELNSFTESIDLKIDTILCFPEIYGILMKFHCFFKIGEKTQEIIKVS